MALNVERQYYFDSNGKPFRTMTEARTRMRQLEAASSEMCRFIVGNNEPSATTTFCVVENVFGSGFVVKQTINYR